MVAALDRVAVTWEGTGTSSPITLGSAISAKHVAPTSALDGETVSYLIEHTDKQITEAEWGRGVYTHSGTTLARTEIIGSTDGGIGGSAVNFSAGVKHVRLTILASDLQGRFISALPEGTIDGAADYLAFWDATDSTLKKIKPNNLPSASGLTLSTVTATPDEGVYTLSASDSFLPNGKLIETAADSTDIEVPASGSGGDVGVAIFRILVGHSDCTLSITGDPGGADINGNGSTAVPLGSPGSTVDVFVLGSDVIRVEGETGEESKALNNVDMAGFKIGGNLADVLTSVSGALTKATHSGKGLILSGNVTVPNASGDVGFNAMLYAASGSETITFNSLTSPGLVQDESVSVFVWSTTVIEAVGTESGRLTFS